MSGVEILSVEQVAIAWDYNWTAFWIFLALSLACSAFLGLVATGKSDDWSDFAAYIITGFVLGACVAVLIGGLFEIPVEYTNQYKVTISDEVSLNEFNEQYEIIDQEGKIYTVRERVEQ